jgi:hypothetical protein
VIRPENEASQSLYKKLGFRQLYRIVRMIFTPAAWQESESESDVRERDNLENTVRQLAIEQRVITALRSSREGNERETIRDCESARTVKNCEQSSIIEAEPESERTEDGEDGEENDENERIFRAFSENQDGIDNASNNCTARVENASAVDDSCGTADAADAAAGDE